MFHTVLNGCILLLLLLLLRLLSLLLLFPFSSLVLFKKLRLQPPREGGGVHAVRPASIGLNLM